MLNGFPLGSGVLYLDEGTTELSTAAAVDALDDAIFANTFDVSCVRAADGHLLVDSPCIDAGTRVGAPLFDMDGQPRDHLPDIGPDEYGP